MTTLDDLGYPLYGPVVNVDSSGVWVVTKEFRPIAIAFVPDPKSDEHLDLDVAYLNYKVIRTQRRT